MWLATTTDLFQAKWSADIHREWMRNVLANRPDLSAKRLERTRILMDANVEDCLITGYEQLIEELTLPDPDDRHVLAAAITAGATVIITFNLRDFPEDRLSPYGIKAVHPDEFVLMLLNEAPDTVCAVAEEHRQALQNPPKTREQYLDTLNKQGLIETAKRLRELAESTAT